MSKFCTIASQYADPEDMASAYLKLYFGNSKITYPINPFQMLKDEGINFALRNFKNLEGVYIPAKDSVDVPIVGINAKRPITRQRYTAAHELCHHFRDADNEMYCVSNSNHAIERYAENFAAALLMPLPDLSKEVEKHKNSQGYVDFDNVLIVAHFFGVSFQACLFRIAYRLHVIEGNTEPSELKKRIQKFAPETKRREFNLSYANLFADLIDCYSKQLTLENSEHAKTVFQNNYIYNDSRLEGLLIEQEEASAIVTDIRLNKQQSKYCTESNEAYMSIAGHYDMYQNIFKNENKAKLSVYDTITLNQQLFAYYPYPEFGGIIRQNNTLVIGAKFETIDCHDILSALDKIDSEVNEYIKHRFEMPLSEYIKAIIRTHHKLTVIHPFSDGNGRTLRVFMNTQLIFAHITPLYIKLNEKQEYINALAYADKENNYEPLYELIFKALLRSNVELSLHT